MSLSVLHAPTVRFAARCGSLPTLFKCLPTCLPQDAALVDKEDEEAVQAYEKRRGTKHGILKVRPGGQGWAVAAAAAAAGKGPR